MDDVAEVARLLAWSRRRLVPVRQTSNLSNDPTDVFGVVFIRLVGEESPQAVGYGRLDGQPEIITIPDGRPGDGKPLEPFARAFAGYVDRALYAERLPRLWLGHTAALHCLRLLGCRYRKYKAASQAVQRLGWICDGLVSEAEFSGQQALVVATDLIRTHIATGQPPTADMHLPSLLIWLEAQPGADPAREADLMALSPAGGMLSLEDDQRVEALRQVLRRNKSRAGEAQTEIETILRRGALREWDLLLRARRGFWGLGLRPDPRLSRLERASLGRVSYSLNQYRNPPSGPHSLARLMDEHEAAVELAEAIDILSDPVVRERARRAGRVVRAEVRSVYQPATGTKPCRLTLATSQQVLRIRPGTRLESMDGRTQGRVVTLTEGAIEGETLFELDLSKGYSVRSRPGLGEQADWADTVLVDGLVGRGRGYAVMQQAKSPLVYPGKTGPKPIPGAGVSLGELLEIAEGLR